MNTSLLALVAFCGWTLLLSLSVVIWRGPLMLSGFDLNGFPSGTPHGPDRYWRLNRAHINAAENLPVFATIILVGNVAGLVSHGFAQCALIVPCARVVQSIVHVASNSKVAVGFRFTAFSVQWLAMATLILMLLQWV